MAKRKSKKNNKENQENKKNKSSAAAGKKSKNISKIFKKTMTFSAILMIVCGIGFGGSFLHDPTSAVSTVGYELYDITVNLFSEYDNLKYGIPVDADRIINREGYAIGYSYKHKQPLWVSYILTADEVKNKKSKRTDDFRSDWRLFGRSAQPEDYKGSDYDRGHLAPAADMGWSSKTMSQSFLMSNMSPQCAELNRGAWRELEEKVREYAVKHKYICVITGPIFKNANRKHIGNSSVTVPDSYYKVIYAPEHGYMAGFIMPNDTCDSDLSHYAVTVDEVEVATQMEFFMNAAPNIRKEHKNKIDRDFWDL